jgi:outer membrane protein assembly factor BamB
VVYVGSANGKVYALRASTGHKLWSHRTGFAILNSSPAVVNGEVYVGSENGKVYAFDLATNRTTQRVARPSASRLKPNRRLRPSN